MGAFVVDTNVPVVASKRSHADPACVIACLDALGVVFREGVIVLDDALRILKEYMDNLNMNGEPGVGDVFMKWVWNIQADESRCERVVLTPLGNNPDDFAEFPNDPDLANFDWSDRKFVAAALTSVKDPTVLNAVDRDWAECHDALERNGVIVRFLCPQHVRCL